MAEVSDLQVIHPVGGGAANGLFDLLILCRKTFFLTVCRAGFKSLSGIGQKCVSSAVIRTLSDLIFTANTCLRAPLKSFQYDAGLTFFVPDAAFNFSSKVRKKLP